MNFRMSAKSFEDHTATIGPGDPENRADLLPRADRRALRSRERRSIPRGVFPSEPPGPTGSIGALTPTFHGNGFWNSGVTGPRKHDAAAAINAVTFSAPRTYNFYCMIHPFMHGTVVVQ